MNETGGLSLKVRALQTELTRLSVLASGPLVIAVSGGVDSVTLAVSALAQLGPTRVLAVHAASAAVPGDAQQRLNELSSTRGLPLQVVTAGELSNEKYLQNPHNRCYFCKTQLYQTLSQLGAVVCSGTNTDDLDDVRPGLVAAHEFRVHHPFMVAGMNKQDVRDVASSLGLHSVASMPSSPCLSSRVETGIRIDERTLRAIDEVETSARKLGVSTVRARVRQSGVAIEHSGALTDHVRAHIAEAAALAFGVAAEGVQFAPYERGSAFLRVLP
jgi:pyridinium-3,5-biscarboxylic acid mononucleotide sulfurtransferase